MPSGTSAGGGTALSAAVSGVGKRTGLLLPPSPPTSRPKPQDCESGIGSRTSTLRSVASSSAAATSSPATPTRTTPLKGSTASTGLRKATGGSSSTAHLVAGPGRVGQRILSSSGGGSAVVVGGGAVSSACPSCGMPFDKAKKRRLIDACGHERCYSCMFANEACPLCAASTMMASSSSKEGGGGRPTPLGAPPGGNIDIVVLPKAKKVSGNSLSASNASIRASETALYGGREGSRSKMKTNGHFTSYMKSRHHQQQPTDAADGDPSQWASSSSWRPPKAHPSIRLPHSSSSSSYSSSSAATHSTAICRHISPDTANAIRMTQSCPTPPQTRRRFFLSAKSLKNPWRQHHQETTPGAVDPGGGSIEAPVETKGSSPLNALMTASAIAESVTSSLATSLTSSWSSTGTWAEGAIRRIKALWWGGPPTAHNGGPRGSRGGGTVGLNILAREEGSQLRDRGEVDETASSVRQGVGPCRTRGASRTSQSDLHVRLGLLLGDEGAGWSPDPDCQSRVMGGSGYADREARSPDTGSSSGCRSSLSPPRSCAPSSGGVGPLHRRGPSGCSSLLLSASLVSLDAPRPPHGGADGGAASSRVIGTSNNTSPASTLTGSSEADVQCRGGRYVVGNRVTPRGLAAAARDRSSDSLASLASLCSSTSPANTTQQQTRRRHSVTTLQPGQVEDLDAFGVRRASIRRSARGGTVADGPTDPKIRFAQFLRRQKQQQDAQCHLQPQQQLTLRPLFFEVPLPEWDAPRPLFVGRAWLLESIASHLKLPPLIPSMYSSQTGGATTSESTVPSTGTARRSKRQGQNQQTSGASSSGQEIKSPSPCNQTVSDGRGVAIVGGPGTGKTALLLQLVESSCFGRHREPPCRDLHRCGGSSHPGAEDKCCLNLVSEKVQALASHVVAYHFCQAENNSTCLVPDFVHSVAAQLCQAPQLVAYRDLLLTNPELQEMLSLPHCIADPDEAIVKGILEPLESIGAPKFDADSLSGSFHQNLSDSYHGENEAMQSSLHGKMQSSYHSSMQGSGQGSQFGDGFCKDMMSSSTGEDSVDRKASCIILVDGLCEAEYHRPDRGPSLGTFLAMHSKRFPPWLKLIVTARTRFADTVLAKDLPYTRISLDDISTDENLQRDLVDYIHFRASHSPTIRANLSLASPSNTLPPQQQQQQTSPTTSISGMPSAAMAPHGEAAAITRFSHHLLRLSGGSFLFTKLTLDLIERGQLVTKSSSYKVLPLTLAQIFLLHFNLRFHTVRAFERVLPILSVVLASLSPPTLLEVFYSVNALRVERFLSWDEFVTRFKTLSGFIVKRLDDTYMFFHPAFREWLIRREEGDSTKFLCDPRIGHLGVALRLTRLQSPLEGEALLELGHHILKAHPHRGLTLRWPLCSRDLQATWVAGAAADASRSLAALRNSYAPNVKVSRLLLLAGASPNARLDATPGDPLLCVAAQRGDTEVVSLLLEFGADAGADSSIGCTALSLAASAGHEGVVAALLNARGPAAGAGRMDPEGRCPLVQASLGGHMGVVALLLSSDWVVSGSGREVSLEEASVQSLVAAAMQGHTELVEYLLDMCNVSPDVVDRLTGETALTASVSYGRHSTAAALLMRGASVTVPNSKGLPPLVAAVSGGGCTTVRRQGTVCSVVELLLQVGGASSEQRDSSGRTALAHAAADGNVTLVRLLLEKGTSVHLEDKEGLSALGWACLKGQVATARVLLDAGAQVQRADASGRTPLHLAAAAPSACQQSSTPLVQLLLERGAVLEGVDAMGLRPLDRAVGTRNISGVHCFLRRGARLGPATWAMAAGKPDVTLILLNKLLEDGNVLYKKGRLQEASHRYRYALKKCPSEEETVACAGVEGGWALDDEEDSPAKLRELFDSVRVHLMLNLSRCTRKLGEYSEAVELAEGVLRLRPDSYEAHYARAKAKVDLGDVDGALLDIEEALRVVPSANREARRVLRRVQEELQAEVCPKVSTTKREPCLGEDERVLEE